ncbi:MAG: arylsulfatase [Akkermansiaceae bacterium]
MKSLFKLTTSFCLSITPLISHGGESEQQSHPNIVVIYADDLGYGDVSCYNPDRGKISTPHIDQLAKEGIMFTDAHSSSAVCTPSRYTLLTGRYHWRSRLQKGIVTLWERPLITPDRLTVASLAKRKGYRTACVGKWHLGWNWPITEDKKKFFKSGGYRGKKDLVVTEQHREAWRETFSKPIKGGPTAVGFDLYFGTDVPNWPPYCFIENDRTVGIPSEYGDQSLFAKNMASQQGPALKGWTLEPILPALVDRSTKFIETASKASEPFLLYIPLTTPHTPLSVNELWKGKSGINALADLVMETDAAVGSILEALKKSGAAQNTLVIFTSDNGSAHYAGVPEQEEKGHFPSGPLRGYKADAWEGGHRVPFVVRWPSMVTAGKTSDALVHQADLMATFADLLGIELDENEGEDSFSLLPLFKNEQKSVRTHSVSTSIKGIPSIRSNSWKFIPVPGSGGWGKGGDQSQPTQLYDLSKDIAEQNNLAAKNPNKVSEMKDLLELLIQNGRSNDGPKQENDVRVTRHH